MFGVAEVETPQSGGAGCGYTSSFSLVVSSTFVDRLCTNAVCFGDIS